MAKKPAEPKDKPTTLIDQVREKQQAAKLKRQLEGFKVTVILENAKDDREDEPAPPPPDPQVVKSPIRDGESTVRFQLPTSVRLRSKSGGPAKITFSISVAG